MKTLLVHLLAILIVGCSKVSDVPPAPAAEVSLSGRLLYSHDDDGIWNVYLESLLADGTTTAPVKLVQGRYPRWSPDGTRLAFWRSEGEDHSGSLWVASADPETPDPRLVTKNAHVASEGLACPLDWHPDGLRLIHLPRENDRKGLALTSIASGETALFGRTDLRYTGEPQYSADGSILNIRGSKAHIEGLSWRPVLSIDTATGEHTTYAIGCCSSISPSGAWSANNTPLHRYMDIWSSDFKAAASLRAKSVLPTHGLWDDWHWSNHERYITTRSDGFPQSGVPDDAFLIDIVAQKAIPLTTGARGTDWPDFFVDSGLPNTAAIKAIPRDALAEVEAFKEAKRKGAEGIPTIVVRAKLRAINPIPPKSTRAYPNYLIDAEWELLETLTDEWIGSRFTAIHYGIKEDKEIGETTSLEVGTTHTLTLQPWDARQDLHNLGRLGFDELNFDRKEFFVVESN